MDSEISTFRTSLARSADSGSNTKYPYSTFPEDVLSPGISRSRCIFNGNITTAARSQFRLKRTPLSSTQSENSDPSGDVGHFRPHYPSFLEAVGGIERIAHLLCAGVRKPFCRKPPGIKAVFVAHDNFPLKH